MMALHLVPPQPSDEDSVSCQGDGAEPCFTDCSSEPPRASFSCFPSSTTNVAHDFSLFRNNDGKFVNANDMAISKVKGGDHCLSHGIVKRLPPGTRPVRLVGEGAANAVFEIKLPEQEGAGKDLRGFLLRVAKAPANNSMPAYNYFLQQKFLQKAIKPILSGHVVHQELVKLRGSGIVRELNNHLAGVNDSRKDKFKNTYVGETDWGFLVEDMRPQDTESCVLVEFKPKWLSQSPSAPQDAIRCRQCAMELRHLVKDLSKNKAHPENKPCPLALTGSDCPLHVRSPFRMAPHLANLGDESFYREALRRVATHAAIRDLKEQQDTHDKLGPLHASPSDPFFPLAMTLRDCTCFAQIDKSSQSIRIRFGDFDWKDPTVKFEQWRRVEEELIVGGFYTAEWIYCDDAFFRPPSLCLLEYSDLASAKRPALIRITDSSLGAREEAVISTDDVEIHHFATDAAVLKRLLEPFKADAPDIIKSASLWPT